MRIDEITDETPEVDWDTYDALSGYVTYGEMTRPDQFDRAFEKLWTAIERPDHPYELYRVYRLDAKQLAELQQTGQLHIQPRRFSSWTKSEAAAKRMLTMRRRDDHAVIVQHTFSPAQILVDVADFYSHYGLDNYEVSEWGKYVRPEQEVIVRDPPTVIAASEIIASSNDLKPNEPQVGDRYFRDDEDEEGEEIIEVDAEQPYRQRGVFAVHTENYGRRYVRESGDGEWEDIEEFL